MSDAKFIALKARVRDLANDDYINQDTVKDIIADAVALNSNACNLVMISLCLKIHFAYEVVQEKIRIMETAE